MAQSIGIEIYPRFISKAIWNLDYDKGYQERVYHFHKQYPEPSESHNVQFFYT